MRLSKLKPKEKEKIIKLADKNMKICNDIPLVSFKGHWITIHQLSELIGSMVDKIDPFTHKHSEMVSVFAYMLAFEMGVIF